MIRRQILRHRRLASLARRVRRFTRRFERQPRPAVAATRIYPESFRVRPIPAPISGAWPEPPPVEQPFRAQVERGPATAPSPYDLALFESLNAEYATKPVAPTAPQYDPATLKERSRRRIQVIHDHLDLRGRTVLEVGCGAGYEVWYLARQLGCDAWGIDISPRIAWPSLVGERVHLVEGDIAVRDTLPANTFDRVISFTVWEHITHPLEAITELARVMKPGGLASIRANLYRGPTASHRTRDIAFPFPHLLFHDSVIDEAMRRAGKAPGGSAWVNRLTWEQYESAFVSAGFVIRSLTFTLYPLDEDFYHRFEDILGRYPRVDLERGFFQVVLEKPAS